MIHVAARPVNKYKNQTNTRQNTTQQNDRTRWIKRERKRAEVNEEETC